MRTETTIEGIHDSSEKIVHTVRTDNRLICNNPAIGSNDPVADTWGNRNNYFSPLSRIIALKLLPKRTMTDGKRVQKHATLNSRLCKIATSRNVLGLDIAPDTAFATPPWQDVAIGTEAATHPMAEQSVPAAPENEPGLK